MKPMLTNNQRIIFIVITDKNTNLRQNCPDMSLVNTDKHPLSCQWKPINFLQLFQNTSEYIYSLNQIWSIHIYLCIRKKQRQNERNLEEHTYTNKQSIVLQIYFIWYNLSTFTTDTACQLNIFWHDLNFKKNNIVNMKEKFVSIFSYRNPFSMNCA